MRNPAASELRTVAQDGGSDLAYRQAMPTKTIQLACPRCRTVALHTQEVPNHLLHLLLTIFTAGLWIIVWIILAMGSKAPVCQNCQAIAMNQAVQQSGYPPPPPPPPVEDMCVVCLRRTTHVMTPFGKLACQDCQARAAR